MSVFPGEDLVSKPSNSMEERAAGADENDDLPGNGHYCFVIELLTTIKI